MHSNKPPCTPKDMLKVSGSVIMRCVYLYCGECSISICDEVSVWIEVSCRCENSIRFMQIENSLGQRSMTMLTVVKVKICLIEFDSFEQSSKFIRFLY